MFIKALSVFILIAAVEMVHGILRAKLIAPRVGDFRSRQLGVFTGSLLILAIAMLTIGWIDPPTASDAFTIGLIWFVCMFAFEMSIGHYLFKFSWKWLLNDFNLFKGRLLAIGMLFLFFAPYIAGKLHGRW